MITAPGGTEISYDPAGRIYGLTQGSAATRFEHLGARMMIERNSSGAVLRRYVHGPGEDEPLVWYEGAGTTDKRWLHSDERGSVVAVTNGTGGDGDQQLRRIWHPRPRQSGPVRLYRPSVAGRGWHELLQSTDV